MLELAKCLKEKCFDVSVHLNSNPKKVYLSLKICVSDINCM